MSRLQRTANSITLGHEVLPATIGPRGFLFSMRPRRIPQLMSSFLDGSAYVTETLYVSATLEAGRHHEVRGSPPRPTNIAPGVWFPCGGSWTRASGVSHPPGIKDEIKVGVVRYSRTPISHIPYHYHGIQAPHHRLCCRYCDLRSSQPCSHPRPGLLWMARSSVKMLKYVPSLIYHDKLPECLGSTQALEEASQ